MKRAVLAFVAFLCVISASQARWKPEYAQNSQEVRDWYRRQQTTPETRARLNADWYMSCCDHGDVVDGQFSKIDGQWVYRLPREGNWRSMPQDIVQIDIPTPHGSPVLFVDSTGRNFGPICFFPGAAGT